MGSGLKFSKNVSQEVKAKVNIVRTAVYVRKRRRILDKDTVKAFLQGILRNNAGSSGGRDEMYCLEQTCKSQNSFFVIKLHA
tara:strand:+ start:119 stop:364 length:246 start_codon:yes stop_codon:yes gene_type:complete